MGKASPACTPNVTARSLLPLVLQPRALVALAAEGSWHLKQAPNVTNFERNKRRSDAQRTVPHADAASCERRKSLELGTPKSVVLCDMLQLRRALHCGELQMLL